MIDNNVNQKIKRLYQFLLFYYNYFFWFKQKQYYIKNS